jgi:hypothetical protein
MKKFFIVALILALAVGTAYAADETFKVGGEYRMEMYNLDDEDYNSDADDQKQYVDQRFRVQADFMPADGVKAVWRADFAETTWGTVDKTIAPKDESGIGYRPNTGQRYNDTIMVDKAYVDLTYQMINVKAGLWGTAGLGMGLVTDDQATQIEATANFAPVTVVATWRKISENASLSDEDDPQKDTDLYGGEVKYAAEAFSAGALYATRDNKADEDVRNVFGLYGSMAFGKLNLWGELDSFSGSDDVNDVDYVGMNLTLEGSMAVTEQLGIFVNLHYAPGTDADDEEQITYLTDDAAYLPFEQGPFAWIWGPGLDPHMVDSNTGAFSMSVRGDFAIMDNLNLMGLIAYMMPSEEDPDGDDNYIDSVMQFTAGATYTFLPGASFSLQYTTVSRSVTNDGPAATEISDDPLQMMGGLLKVKF